jgi:hypothetical protein
LTFRALVNNSHDVLGLSFAPSSSGHARVSRGDQARFMRRPGFGTAIGLIFKDSVEYNEALERRCCLGACQRAHRSKKSGPSVSVLSPAPSENKQDRQEYRVPKLTLIETAGEIERSFRKRVSANLSRRHHANLRMALWLTRRFNIVLVGTSHCLSRNHNARI